MAAAFINNLVNPAMVCAIAAVSEPQIAIGPVTRAAFDEVRPSQVLRSPSRLTTELAGWAREIIHVGLPPTSFQVEGVPSLGWDIPDPTKAPLQAVRVIRDAIRQRVETLLRERGWLRTSS